MALSCGRSDLGQALIFDTTAALARSAQGSSRQRHGREPVSFNGRVM